MSKRLRRWGRRAAAVLACALAVEAGCRLFFLCRNRLAPRPEAFELYALGGSSMLGAPYEGLLSVPEIVSRMLGDAVRGRRVRILNLAASGETIYPQSFKFKLAVLYRDAGRPGAVSIYSGHNDAMFFGQARPRACAFYGPFKRGPASRSLALSLLMFHGEKARLLPLCRENADFERHMRDAVGTALASGLRPVLSTVVSNAADIEPGFFLEEGGAESQARLDALLSEGEALERLGRWREAIIVYEKMGGAFPGSIAYAWFRIGRCRLGLGRPDAARRCFQEAVDAVTGDSFGRARSWQNKLIRDLAAEYGAPLVDAVGIFEARSPHGLVGESLFADGHHPNVVGYGLLAGGFAVALSRDLGIREPGPAPTGEEMARWFPMTKEQRVRALLQSGRWLVTVSARHARPSVRLELARKRFQEALALAPGDFSASLGLALVAAARRTPAMLRDEEEISWLARQGLFYGSWYEVPRGSVPGILARLAERGAPAALLDRVRASAPR